MSAWTMTAGRTGGGAAYEKPPAGNHPARLVAIVDMGTQWQEGFQGADGKWQHRAFFVWELVNAKQSGSSRNHVIGIDLTFSLNEKAKLRAWVGAQRGKPLGEGEPFDLSTWLGHACLLNVIEKNGYPKIDGVSGVPTGFTVPEPQNQPFAWKVDAARQTGTIDLPTWLPYFYGKPIGDTIREAQELEGKQVEVVNGTTSAASSGGVASNPNTPAGVAPAATSPPARRPRPAAPPGEPADPEFFVDAEGFDDKRTYRLSEIKAAVEGKPGVDLTQTFVVKPGGQDWAPLTTAAPECKGWLPF